MPPGLKKKPIWHHNTRGEHPKVHEDLPSPCRQTGKINRVPSPPDPRNLNTENNAGPKDQSTGIKDPLFRSPTEKNLLAVTTEGLNKTRYRTN